MNIAVAPYAAKLPNDNRNAKNWPFFKELFAMMPEDQFIQLGTKGEQRIEGSSQFIQGFPLEKLEQVVKDCDVWLSVDTWLPHFCATLRLQSGVVIWAQSNPKIWGYPHNVNLLKSKEYLRPFQYAPWFDIPYNEEAFVSPEVVRDALHERLSKTASS
jgi:hypothetical protein